MRPREKTAAERESVGRRLATRPEWEEKADDALKAQAEVRSFMNYASAPLGAKKYDASSLTTMGAR